MKVLCIDYGARRIGIALGDTDLKLAVPKAVLKNSPRVFEEIKKLVKEFGVSRIVVGLPLTPSGREGQRAKEVRKFVESLKNEVDAEIVFWDERYTTLSASEKAKGSKKLKEKIDALSAQEILTEYLNSL